jgi:hypothetical protein
MSLSGSFPPFSAGRSLWERPGLPTLQALEVLRRPALDMLRGPTSIDG